MTASLRPASPDDVEAIRAIYADEVSHRAATFELEPPDAAEMARRMAAVAEADLPWLVDEVDGAVAAYGYLTPYRPRAAYRFTVELSVYVAPWAQRRGLGRRMVEALLGEARARGKRQVISAISDGQASGSIALHRACGFREVGVLDRVGFKFDRWIDVTLMQRDLTD